MIKLFAAWRTGLLLITLLGSLTIPLSANKGLGAAGVGKNFDFWASWAQWDGGHFFSIAANGYRNIADFAFFPLYPLITHAVSRVLGGNVLIAGLIVANLSFLIFLITFYKYVSQKYSKEIARDSTVTFLTFPTAFFCAAFYSESLFLVQVALFFLLLHREKYFWAAILAASASLTRPIGLTLSISLIYSYLAKSNFEIKKINLKALQLALSVFGVLAYSLFLFYKYQNPFLYLSSQRIWQRLPNDPFSTVTGYISAALSGVKIPAFAYLDLFFTLVFLAILVAGIKKISSSFWIFSLLAILIPASSSTLDSMPRYALASLGSFVILGKFFEKRPKAKIIFWSFSLAAQAILTALFINGYWVA